MRKIFLVIFMLSIAILPAQAGSRGIQIEPAVATITGTIERLGKNSMDIADESDHKIKRLVYFSGRRKFKVGDRVRVRYDTRSRVVEIVSRMTTVERKEGQNAGYIFKK